MGNLKNNLSNPMLKDGLNNPIFPIPKIPTFKLIGIVL